MIADKKKSRRLQAAKRRQEEEQLVQVARWLASLADAISQGEVNAEIIQLHGVFQGPSGQLETGADQAVLLYLKPDEYPASIPDHVKSVMKKWMGHND